jgi:hypothetical protein
VKRSTLGRVICGSLAVALLSFPVLEAQQSATGSIGGTVTDPSGNLVPNSAVTLTNASQGTVRTFTTHNDGAFLFTTLEAVDYSVSATASSGFAIWRQAVTLEAGQSRKARSGMTWLGGS